MIHKNILHNLLLLNQYHQHDWCNPKFYYMYMYIHSFLHKNFQIRCVFFINYVQFKGFNEKSFKGFNEDHVELTWSIIFELKYSRINDKIILRVLKHIRLSLSWTMVTLFLHSFSITTGQQQNIVKRFIFKMIQFWSSVYSGLLIAESSVYRRFFFIYQVILTSNTL